MAHTARASAYPGVAKTMMCTTMHSCKVLTGLVIGLFVFSFTTQLQAAPDDNLGRLFTRPSERNNLDYLRQNQKLKIVNQQNDQQPNEMDKGIPVELPNPIALQGYVKRSDGSKSTLWINNQPVQEDSTVDNVQIGRLSKQSGSTTNQGSDGLNLKIPANGKHVRLKAGQVYEPETNQIKELRIIEKGKRLNLEETGVIEGSDEKSQY